MRRYDRIMLLLLLLGTIWGIGTMIWGLGHRSSSPPPPSEDFRKVYLGK